VTAVLLFCRWECTHLPEVEFRNGRKMIMFPERFKAEVAATGTCSRTQARCGRLHVSIYCSSGRDMYFIESQPPSRPTRLSVHQ